MAVFDKRSHGGARRVLFSNSKGFSGMESRLFNVSKVNNAWLLRSDSLPWVFVGPVAMIASLNWLIWSDWFGWIDSREEPLDNSPRSGFDSRKGKRRQTLHVGLVAPSSFLASITTAYSAWVPVTWYPVPSQSVVVLSLWCPIILISIWFISQVFTFKLLDVL